VTQVLYELVRANHTPLSSSGACQAVGLRESRYYAWLNHAPEPPDPVLHEIQVVAAQYTRYGYRRITSALHEKCIAVNSKRVLSLMRENNITCRRKRFTAVTTDSNHDLPIYPNLARGLEVTSVNQLWVADITYIRIPNDFAYLAVVMDRFSRKCLGWHLSRDIDSKLCLDALEMAFRERQGMQLDGLVHHSDRGVQYASNLYTNALLERDIQISMSRKGNPYDNAFAESFMKTLKYEEVYLSEYASFKDALENIEKFIEEVYNKKRLHSSLGYKPPAEFERKHLTKVFA